MSDLQPPNLRFESCRDGDVCQRPDSFKRDRSSQFVCLNNSSQPLVHNDDEKIDAERWCQQDDQETLSYMKDSL